MIPTKNLPKLLDSAYSGFNNPAFQPENGVTHCNNFILGVLNGFGYGDMNGMVANDMVAFMSEPKNGWIQIDGGVAQDHANQGVIVIAGWANPMGHGHVNLIVPGVLEMSESFGALVPKCANVGAQVFFGRKVSYAFQPSMKFSYFALAQMI